MRHLPLTIICLAALILAGCSEDQEKKAADTAGVAAKDAADKAKELGAAAAEKTKKGLEKTPTASGGGDGASENPDSPRF